MDTKQWNTLLKESVAACDMSNVIQQADSWLQQGVDYWKAWGAFASSYTVPQTWMETTDGVTKTMESYMKDWAGIYGLGRNTDLDDALAAQQRQVKKADREVEKLNTEKTALKRSLTQKEKTLKSQTAELDRHQKQMSTQEKEIQQLQAKVKTQAERLIMLEAVSKKIKPAAPAKAGASASPAAK